MSDAIRITDPVTGGQKGAKLCQLGALHPGALIELGKVAGFGAKKYDRYNYLLGTQWSLMFDAMMRHALDMWRGEELDPESGLSHAAHVAWHGLALTAFYLEQLGTDDRPHKRHDGQGEANGETKTAT